MSFPVDLMRRPECAEKERHTLAVKKILRIPEEQTLFGDAELNLLIKRIYGDLRFFKVYPLQMARKMRKYLKNFLKKCLTNSIIFVANN
jgi:hypothetical protein